MSAAKCTTARSAHRFAYRQEALRKALEEKDCYIVQLSYAYL